MIEKLILFLKVFTVKCLPECSTGICIFFPNLNMNQRKSKQSNNLLSTHPGEITVCATLVTEFEFSEYCAFHYYHFQQHIVVTPMLLIYPFTYSRARLIAELIV